MEIKRISFRFCHVYLSAFVFLSLILLSLSGCCRCNQDSESYEIIDQPRRGATSIAPKADIPDTFSFVAANDLNKK